MNISSRLNRGLTRLVGVSDKLAEPAVSSFVLGQAMHIKSDVEAAFRDTPPTPGDEVLRGNIERELKGVAPVIEQAMTRVVPLSTNGQIQAARVMAEVAWDGRKALYRARDEINRTINMLDELDTKFELIAARNPGEKASQ